MTYRKVNFALNVCVASLCKSMHLQSFAVINVSEAKLKMCNETCKVPSTFVQL